MWSKKKGIFSVRPSNLAYAKVNIIPIVYFRSQVGNVVLQKRVGNIVVIKKEIDGTWSGPKVGSL